MKSTHCALLLAWLAGAVVCPADGPCSLENAALKRVLSTEGGRLRTLSIVNQLAGRVVTPAPGPADEFRLRFSEGTDRPETAFTVTAADFQVVAATSEATRCVFQLANPDRGLQVEVRYELAPGDFYLRKRLVLTSAQPLTLERVDVEAFPLADAYQPYTNREITASAAGRWSPGLGQPLYTSNSATFWGIEFPAADNQVRDGTLSAGYLWGRRLAAGQRYESYPAVVGVADDPAFVADAFHAYIHRIRVRPLRLQVQYNSWFDYGGGVRESTFTNSVAKIHGELVGERGNRPLSRYVIDDGWQDTGASWSDRVWKVNGKFDPDFATSRRAVADAQSKLGLWLSPGCLFGASAQVGKLRAQGFEAMDNWMSMAGPKYMQALEDRMLELTRQGVGFFKLDGVFGHLNLRNFELHGARYGLPEMPQLGLEGLQAGDPRLNDAKFDELKIYYLTAGTERLMQLFARLAAVDPDIYLIISNGAFLSPWWLMHVDAVWMINAGDAAGGSSRTDELVYRDGRYHEIWRQQRAQFPLASVFNHEPKKTSTGESKDEFRRYLYMNLSRGTGFVELYIKPFLLAAGDWDVISEGLFWAEAVFPTFPHARLHGGSPTARETYGFTAWTADQGYVSVHNPSAVATTYTVRLDRAFGLNPGSGPFHLSSPIADCTNGLPATCRFGNALVIPLQPREIRVLNFTREPADWSRLRALQKRSPETAKPKPPALPVQGHAILGAWEYQVGGVHYTRIFTTNGLCTLHQGKAVNWERPVRVDGPAQVTVEGGLVHRLQPDGTLAIEGRYTARRAPPAGSN